MGLGDLTPQDPDTSSRGSGKKYVQPTKEEFEKCLDSTGYKFQENPFDRSNEVVYEYSGIFPNEPHIVLRIFSTIDKSTGRAREKGSDAIRTVIWHSDHRVPIGGRTKTLRISTYCKNLTEKIESIVNETRDYVKRCSECGGWMVVRESRYGEFYGCSNYPDCDNTEKIHDDTDDSKQ